MKKYLFISIILLTFVPKLNAQATLCDTDELEYVQYKYFEIEGVAKIIDEEYQGVARAYKYKDSKDYDWVWLVYDKELTPGIPMMYDGLTINLNNWHNPTTLENNYRACYFGVYSYLSIENEPITLRIIYIVPKNYIYIKTITK